MTNTNQLEPHMHRKGRSIHLEGVTHGASPIPMGARVGNTLFTSGVAGKLPATNKLVDGAEAQAYQAFANLKTVLANGGATFAHVGLISALVADEAARDALNKAWVDTFPDADDRPARHTTVQPLRGGMLVQLQAIAVVTD